MLGVTENSSDELLARIGRAWGWVLAMGLVSVIVGVVAMVFPGPTLLLIATVFGLQLVALGVFRFVEAIATSATSGWLKAVHALVAVIAVVVGIYLLRHPFMSVLVMAIVLGIFWIAYGVFDLFLAADNRVLPGRGWVIVSAILSIIAGAFVLFAPGISLLTLTVVLGVWLVVYGLILITRSFRLRSATGEARGRVPGRMSPT
jgi:uncharacterized membrane protein HdeD (DUF308 family)